ncbi:peptide ABC transporter substrate-binding protein [soil metagenome]
MSDSPSREGAFSALHQLLKSGQINRRQFLTRATALGVGLSVATFVSNTTLVGAQDSATPATEGETMLSTRPTVGTEGQERGAGGEIKILVAQAPASLSVHVAAGGADIGAASPITEPLLSYAPDGTLLATLASEVPTVENGGVSADLTSVTFKLLPDVLWSDGEPFTADDVVFTYQWIIDPANQSIEQTTYEVVESVEAIDPLTVKVVFKNPQLAWYLPFASGNRGGIYPKHFWDGKDLQTANDAFRSAPIGTGPYVADSITPLDQVIYSANPNYREPNKPYFSSINLKGGSTDAVTSVQAVVQTGEWDLFDNPQITPDVLAGLLENGDKGTVYGVAGTGVEKLEINFSDPNTDVDGQKSQKDTPHPFFSDPAVREALSLTIDRDTISTRFYGGAPIEPAGRNILTGIGIYESPNTSLSFDPATAAQVLDAAGWVLDGDTRSKDGVTLEIDYVTTVNDVRQKTQAVLKNAWEDLGIKVNLVAIEGGVFFDGSVGNDQNFTHFYSDLQMYTDGATSTFPINYMQYWYSGENGDNIAQKENNWNGTNKSRYSNPEYDALYNELALETDPARATELFIQLNDIIIDNFVQIPIVQRAGVQYAAVFTLRRENIAENSFEALFWNIANWNRNA